MKMNKLKDLLTTNERIMLGLSVVLIIMTFLPWASVSALFITLNVTGMQLGYGGILTAILGIILCIVIWAAKSHNTRRIAALIGGILGILIHGIFIIAINSLATEYASNGLVSVSPGIGLILTVFVDLGLIIFAIVKDSQVSEPTLPSE